MLNPLDNQVFFKKAFTDRIVFKAFVRDVVNIDIDPDKIETEKEFGPKVGSIGFRYDIFAEDVKKRIIVEIQRLDYDYNFDRFLHYHLQAVTEQQRSSNDYTIERTVYTIVIITEPYRYDNKAGQILRDEVLVSSLDPQTLNGQVRPLYGHKLLFLNPNFKDDSTPKAIRDWLELIYESIHHRENPNYNRENPDVQRAASLIEFDQMTPREWAESKIEASRKVKSAILREEGLEEGFGLGVNLVVANALKEGLSVEMVSKISGLSIEEVQRIAKDLEEQ